MSDQRQVDVPSTMRAIRLLPPGGLDSLSVERIETPLPKAGEVLIRVRAAAITRDELDWPTDRLPATPSYELSGVVAGIAEDVEGVSVGDAVFGLTPFDRDGVAADFAAVPATVLAAKPHSIDHVASAAVPLAALSAWQGLFDHGCLEPGQRVLILGASGGVGHLATQLAHSRGAYVIGTSRSAAADSALRFGADEWIDYTSHPIDEIAPVDLVFDTVGGGLMANAMGVVKEGGQAVSVAEEPPESADAKVRTSYFIVEPSRQQLVELARLIDGRELRPSVDSVFSLEEAGAAFERSQAGGKRGKVVLRVSDG